MKKFILTLIVGLFALAANGQRMDAPKALYLNVDTLAISTPKKVVHTPKGDFLFGLSELVIAYNDNRTNAVVLKGYLYAKKMEYNVKDDKRRTILWYKDDNLYCGYIYDKKTKECQYFEAMNEDMKKKLIRKVPPLRRILRKMPTFKNE
jgi:hypothetical protein